MSDSLTDSSKRFALPLLAEPTPPAWHGLSARTPISEVAHASATDEPEPLQPQGVYAEATEAPLLLPDLLDAPSHATELLAPAGGKDAALAAFHYGADAIYLGLKKFSARAEAENFTLEEVDEVTAYAHSLTPRRRVFVTVNTLIRQDEIEELVEAVAALAHIGVDALIIQDLGVYHLVRRYFPTLELHASTQLAVHNRPGAETLNRLGFHRVVLARELTFEEVRSITATAGVETEVFVHGALCYAYSGLCLFSSQTLGRSGNRGKCAYSCRDSFEVSGAPLTLRDGSPVQRDPRQGFPFSMKDLALPDHLPALRASGVSCFKIEGRKKSPLYVATTTDYYRRLLDGRLSEEERPDIEADLQTVFSRPWTRLFVQSHKDKEVADRDTVGHRGTPIGHVEALRHERGETHLRFHTARALERHDGLQIDLPHLGKPFGFPVDHLTLVGPRGRSEEVFTAPSGSLVEVPLPPEAPELPLHAPVYCSSSQAVKNRYRYEQPKPGAFRTRQPITVDLFLSSEGLRAQAHMETWDGERLLVTRTQTAALTQARDPSALVGAARAAFEKLGQTPFLLDKFTLHNQENLFVPVSQLNALRRDLTSALEEALSQTRQRQVEQVRTQVCVRQPPAPQASAFRWSLKVDRLTFLEALEESDTKDLEELVLDITRDHPTLLLERLEAWEQRLGRERIRLALPALTRAWEDRGLRHKIERLLAAGWTRWEASNLSAWSYLGLDPTSRVEAPWDLSTDWSVYVLNRLAAQQLLDMGVRRFALSPEDGLANFRSLLAEYREKAVLIVYQDTPLFLAESCAYANLIGGCPGKANCSFESMEMVSSHGESVTALDYHCRTIVLNQGPFCLSPRLGELARAGAVSLRADFVYRSYPPEEVRDRWRRIRAGKPVAGGHAANYERGVL